MLGYDFVGNEKDMGINVFCKDGGIKYVEKVSFLIKLLKYVSVG